MTDVPPFDPATDTGNPPAIPAPVDPAPVVDPAPLPVVDPTTPAPAPAPAPAPPALLVGQMVEHTFFDPYLGPGGQETTVTGLVTHVDDTGARVCWLESSDPIPFGELTAL